MKSVFLKLLKNGWSYCLAVKTTYFTHYLSYLNPEGGGSSNKIDCFMGHQISKLKERGRPNYWATPLKFSESIHLL